MRNKSEDTRHLVAPLQEEDRSDVAEEREQLYLYLAGVEMEQVAESVVRLP